MPTKASLQQRSNTVQFGRLVPRKTYQNQGRIVKNISGVNINSERNRFLASFQISNPTGIAELSEAVEY